MTKSRARYAFASDPSPRTATRACDHPGCAGGGEYRAPKNRNSLNEYWWFCLDHVREYNRAWDYYAGMSPEQIEADLRRDTTWQRPSWPLGYWATQEKFLRDRAAQGFSFEFGREAGKDKEQEKSQRRQSARSAEEEALLILDLAPPVDFARIKARYRELVKIHHPDANGGDRDAEEKLKIINQAYNTLKACYGV
ncbi:J domain-containing protein [Azospirillum thermophilum]|uniref:Molecular chaperone DnaJ n=1 Tax=Azospirillum thermophilum TaxID=2202148 RepID=A0A2S2CP49_9PROT|nr:J domain-containing protein [Azospirillum thermophilum]AWK86303.1 molecular chaperone DnaJ [Azospirillum thermophilum]